MEDGNEGLNQFKQNSKGIRHSYKYLVNSVPFATLSNRNSIFKRSIQAHHSKICCRLESDRNITGPAQWRTKGYRGWISYESQMVL